MTSYGNPSSKPTPYGSSELGYDPMQFESLKPQYILGEHQNYRLEKLLGTGGMGQAWLATQIEGGEELQKVVCKVLPDKIRNDPESMEEVRRTFRLTKGLNHQNICPLHGMFHDQTFGWFLVMAYANGGSLYDWFHRQPGYENGLPLETVLKIAAPIAHALDRAHVKKVIHRDIKPQNVVLNKDRGVTELWLIDFGIAASLKNAAPTLPHKDVSDSGLPTSMVPDPSGPQPGASSDHCIPLPLNGLNAGTPKYMAPEQFLSEPQSAATDQYALATIIYEFLCGHVPYSAKTSMALGILKSTDEYPPISKVPYYVNAALQRALSKFPEKRFPSCSAFLSALRAPAVKRRRKMHLFVRFFFLLLKTFFGFCVFAVLLSFFFPQYFPWNGMTERITSVFFAENTESGDSENADENQPSDGEGAHVPDVYVPVAPGTGLVDITPYLESSEGDDGKKRTKISENRGTRERAAHSENIVESKTGETPKESQHSGFHAEENTDSAVGRNAGPSGSSLSVPTHSESRKNGASVSKTRDSAAGVSVASNSVMIPALKSENTYPPAHPQAGERWEFKYQKISFSFRWCPRGKFSMGAPENPRETEVEQGFWMLETEVTQQQWRCIMNPSLSGNDIMMEQKKKNYKGKNSPPGLIGAKYPMHYVCYDECCEFCARLSRVISEDPGVAAGKKIRGDVRIPTEIQWEYACRAGTESAFCCGETLSEKYAVFGTGCTLQRVPSGERLEEKEKEKKREKDGKDEKKDGNDFNSGKSERLSNRWGLYDMHGNVWEWCSGMESHPVIRGGAWNVNAESCKSTSKQEPGTMYCNIGFRVALTFSNEF